MLTSKTVSTLRAEMLFLSACSQQRGRRRGEWRLVLYSNGVVAHKKGLCICLRKTFHARVSFHAAHIPLDAPDRSFPRLLALAFCRPGWMKAQSCLLCRPETARTEPQRFSKAILCFGSMVYLISSKWMAWGHRCLINDHWGIHAHSLQVVYRDIQGHIGDSPETLLGMCETCCISQARHVRHVQVRCILHTYPAMR